MDIAEVRLNRILSNCSPKGTIAFFCFYNKKRFVINQLQDWRNGEKNRNDGRAMDVRIRRGHTANTHRQERAPKWRFSSEFSCRSGPLIPEDKTSFLGCSSTPKNEDCQPELTDTGPRIIFWVAKKWPSWPF